MEVDEQGPTNRDDIAPDLRDAKPELVPFLELLIDSHTTTTPKAPTKENDHDARA